MWFHIIVKVVSVKSGLEAKRLDAEVMAFVEQMGGYFE